MPDKLKMKHWMELNRNWWSKSDLFDHNGECEITMDELAALTRTQQGHQACHFLFHQYRTLTPLYLAFRAVLVKNRWCNPEHITEGENLCPRQTVSTVFFHNLYWEQGYLFYSSINVLLGTIANTVCDVVILVIARLQIATQCNHDDLSRFQTCSPVCYTSNRLSTASRAGWG